MNEWLERRRIKCALKKVAHYSSKAIYWMERASLEELTGMEEHECMLKQFGSLVELVSSGANDIVKMN